MQGQRIVFYGGFMLCSIETLIIGQVENTEGQKTKHRSEKKKTLCLLVSSALLTYDYVCWGLVAKGDCLPAMWEPDPGGLGRHGGISGQTQRKTNYESWLYATDAFVTVIVLNLCQLLNKLHNYF